MCGKKYYAGNEHTRKDRKQQKKKCAQTVKTASVRPHRGGGQASSERTRGTDMVLCWYYGRHARKWLKCRRKYIQSRRKTLPHLSTGIAGRSSWRNHNQPHEELQKVRYRLGISAYSCIYENGTYRCSNVNKNHIPIWYLQVFLRKQEPGAKITTTCST